MFSIFRDRTALALLNETWEQADEGFRAAIVRASQAVDRLLQHEPQCQGESREDDTRILFQAPLSVLFAVDESQKLVRIRRVWTHRARIDRGEV